MSKTFTCCELVERVKEFIGESRWGNEEKRYQALEFIDKAALKLVYKGKNESGAEKNIWDSLFCEECKKWFEEKKKKQFELIDSRIEKEKREGTFYTNPSTQKALREVKQKADKWQKELGKSELNFGKSPQE